MRPIHLAHVDQKRPALVLTRDVARGRMLRVTVAPITSTIKGLTTEVAVGHANSLDHESVVSLDNIHTIETTDLGEQIGWFLDHQETDLTAALHAAFDLEDLS